MFFLGASTVNAEVADSLDSFNLLLPACVHEISKPPITPVTPVLTIVSKPAKIAIRLSHSMADTYGEQIYGKSRSRCLLLEAPFLHGGLFCGALTRLKSGPR